MRMLQIDNFRHIYTTFKPKQLALASVHNQSVPRDAYFTQSIILKKGTLLYHQILTLAARWSGPSNLLFRQPPSLQPQSQPRLATKQRDEETVKRILSCRNIIGITRPCVRLKRMLDLINHSLPPHTYMGTTCCSMYLDSPLAVPVPRGTCQTLLFNLIVVLILLSYSLVAAYTYCESHLIPSP